jgi:hypothetical protein
LVGEKGEMEKKKKKKERGGEEEPVASFHCSAKSLSFFCPFAHNTRK